jgi:hypothetical protein
VRIVQEKAIPKALSPLLIEAGAGARRFLAALGMTGTRGQGKRK